MVPLLTFDLDLGFHFDTKRPGGENPRVSQACFYKETY